MKRKIHLKYPLAALLMIVMIIDSKETISAAAQGIELCIRSVIPSLFPFFVLSGILVPGISKLRIPVLDKILRVPKGWESVFVLSCIGGYPVGAQCICQGFKSGQLSRNHAIRMLGFCNNCGPAFLFGIAGSFFPHPGYAAGIFLCGIVSAIVVAYLWPGATDVSAAAPEIPAITLPQAVRQAISSMSGVCAWIVLGKILVHALNRFLLAHLAAPLSSILIGILELTNGCLSLAEIAPLSLRFSAASMMCSFGGLCVAMQVNVICANAGLPSGSYIPQKLMQGAFAFLLSALLFHRGAFFMFLLVPALWILSKTAVAFPGNLVYNNHRKGGFHHAVPKEN